MKEPDPLHALLREWKSPEPAAELDQKVVDAYRTVPRGAGHRPPAWRRFWDARISVPAPLLLAAVAVIALLIFRFHSNSTPGPALDAARVVTRLNATGFEPLPHGEARIVPARETRE
jgi:hypothetical protein